MPNWGGGICPRLISQTSIIMQNPVKTSRQTGRTFLKIFKTFDKLGIPEAERKFLGGVGAQDQSEVVYHSLREDLGKKESFS